MSERTRVPTYPAEAYEVPPRDAASIATHLRAVDTWTEPAIAVHLSSHSLLRFHGPPHAVPFEQVPPDVSAARELHHRLHEEAR